MPFVRAGDFMNAWRASLLLISCLISQAWADCGSVTREGSCDGDVLTFCKDNQVKTFDCSEDGITGAVQYSCGYISEQIGYDCKGPACDAETDEGYCVGDVAVFCYEEAGSTWIELDCKAEYGSKYYCAGGYCYDGSEIENEGCADVPPQGRCDGQILSLCLWRNKITFDCAEEGQVCGWDGDSYSCLNQTDAGLEGHEDAETDSGVSDAGTADAETDSGVSEADGAASETDSGASETDAAVSETDSGDMEADSGATEADSGVSEADGAAGEADAEPPASGDASQDAASTDAGTTSNADASAGDDGGDDGCSAAPGQKAHWVPGLFLLGFWGIRRQRKLQ